MSDKIRVMYIARRELSRAGIRSILQESGKVEVVHTCSSGLEGIKKCGELKPDVVLVDTETADCDCCEVILSMHNMCPGTRIVVLTMSEENGIFFSAMKSGARAYLTKDITADELVRNIVQINEGEVIISPRVADKLLREFAFMGEYHTEVRQVPSFDLSPRENEVLGLVAKGYSNKEIASELCLSESTVKSHLSRVMEKLHVHTRQRLALLASEKGVISEDNSNT